MNHVPAWLTLLGLIAAILGCIHEENGRNQGLPLVHASEPASVVPWRLLTLCPVNSSNIPHYKDRIA